MEPGSDLNPNGGSMSIPTLRSIGRLALVSLGIALLYIALDAGLLALGSRVLASGGSWPGESARLDAEAQRIAALAAAHPSAARPELRLAAWRVGHAFGIASQARHTAAVTGNPKLAALADGVLRDVDDDARRLGVAPVAALDGRSIAEAAALPQRIDADESGLAARIEAATTLQHRHLFLAGAHTGLEWVARATPGAPEGRVVAAFIQRHARLAGLEPAKWQPLVDPPGADAAQRRAAFLSAIAAVEQGLGAAGPR
jgi:hypothetical protein